MFLVDSNTLFISNGKTDRRILKMNFHVLVLSCSLKKFDKNMLAEKRIWCGRWKIVKRRNVESELNDRWHAESTFLRKRGTFLNHWFVIFFNLSWLQSMECDRRICDRSSRDVQLFESGRKSWKTTEAFSLERNLERDWTNSLLKKTSLFTFRKVKKQFVETENSSLKMRPVYRIPLMLFSAYLIGKSKICFLVRREKKSLLFLCFSWMFEQNQRLERKNANAEIWTNDTTRKPATSIRSKRFERKFGRRSKFLSSTIENLSLFFVFFSWRFFSRRRSMFALVRIFVFIVPTLIRSGFLCRTFEQRNDNFLLLQLKTKIFRRSEFDIPSWFGRSSKKRTTTSTFIGKDRPKNDVFVEFWLFNWTKSLDETSLDENRKLLVWFVSFRRNLTFLLKPIEENLFVDEAEIEFDFASISPVDRSIFYEGFLRGKRQSSPTRQIDQIVFFRKIIRKILRSSAPFSPIVLTDFSRFSTSFGRSNRFVVTDDTRSRTNVRSFTNYPMWSSLEENHLQYSVWDDRSKRIEPTVRQASVVVLSTWRSTRHSGIWFFGTKVFRFRSTKIVSHKILFSSRSKNKLVTNNALTALVFRLVRSANEIYRSIRFDEQENFFQGFQLRVKRIRVRSAE